jgi:hypothetical protein
VALKGQRKQTLNTARFFARPRRAPENAPRCADNLNAAGHERETLAKRRGPA